MIDFLKEFIEFLGERKKYWLLPIIVVLALFGVLIVLRFRFENKNSQKFRSALLDWAGKTIKNERPNTKKLFN